MTDVFSLENLNDLYTYPQNYLTVNFRIAIKRMKRKRSLNDRKQDLENKRFDPPRSYSGNNEV